MKTEEMWLVNGRNFGASWEMSGAHVKRPLRTMAAWQGDAKVR